MPTDWSDISDEGALADALQIRGRTSLRDDAACRLRSAILAGILKPGEPLVEARISSLMGVSRAPLREAILILQLEGLADQRPNRGAHVVTVSSSDVREIYGLRAALEGWAAYVVTTRKSSNEIADLHEFVHVKLGATGAPNDLFAADLEFHGQVCKLTYNRRLLDRWVFLKNQALLCYSLTGMQNALVDEQSKRELRAEHFELVNLLEGPADLAQHAFAQHCLRASERLIAIMERNDSDVSASGLRSRNE